MIPAFCNAPFHILSNSRRYSSLKNSEEEKTKNKFNWNVPGIGKQFSLQKLFENKNTYDKIYGAKLHMIWNIACLLTFRLAMVVNEI